MKRVLIVVLSLLIVSCSGSNEKDKVGSTQVNEQQTSTFKSIDAVQANKLIKTRKDLLILDVRTPPELRAGKIKDSILVPFWDIAKGRYQVPADKPVLVVCAVGGRSYAIGQLLHKKNYHEVYSLSGGISGWKRAGMPVVY